MGLAKDAADTIMGTSVRKGWRLVSLPFCPEYPGDRQWNRNAPQFLYQPATLESDQAPHHPHWDMICDHIGMELTPVLRDLPWAQKANIQTGGDYIRRPGSPAPSASHLSNLPYIFLWGSERAGKSTLHQALSLLVTKGVVKADKALATNNEFNGELAGAIVCAVEEIDITLTPGAYARIKEWTTAGPSPSGKCVAECLPSAQHNALDSNRQ